MPGAQRSACCVLQAVDKVVRWGELESEEEESEEEEEEEEEVRWCHRGHGCPAATLCADCYACAAWRDVAG